MQNHSNQSSEVLAQRQTFQRPELKTPEKEAEWRLPGAGGRGNELLSVHRTSVLEDGKGSGGRWW